MSCNITVKGCWVKECPVALLSAHNWTCRPSRRSVLPRDLTTLSPPYNPPPWNRVEREVSSSLVKWYLTFVYGGPLSTEIQNNGILYSFVENPFSRRFKETSLCDWSLRKDCKSVENWIKGSQKTNLSDLTRLYTFIRTYSQRVVNKFDLAGIWDFPLTLLLSGSLALPWMIHHILNVQQEKNGFSVLLGVLGYLVVVVVKTYQTWKISTSVFEVTEVPVLSSVFTYYTLSFCVVI